ncbi:MAG: hypothetical protein C0507_10680 [Cyanobacteria bacterium PR.3.49]|nr:hypothetical protein [Cyanobacteria bacterium PR.3.49]
MSIKDPYSFISNKLNSRGDRHVHATYLCVLLDEAEELFGPRLDPYPCMYTGINFEGNRSQIYFWGKGKSSRFKYVNIRLRKACRTDLKLAISTLAHECVHLLSPVLAAEITNLEEGLACWHAKRWAIRAPQAVPEKALDPYSDDRYNKALSAVEKLLAADEKVVLRIRQIEPDISKITADQILLEAPWLNEKEAKWLVAKFPARANYKKWRERQKAVQNEMDFTPEKAEPRIDKRAVELSRQVARLKLGMQLLPERLKQFELTEAEVYIALARSEGVIKS